MIKTLKELFYLLNPQQKANFIKLQVLVIIMSLLELVAIASIGPFMAIVAKPEIVNEHSAFLFISELTTLNDLHLLAAIGSAVLFTLTFSSLFSLFVTWKLTSFGALLGADLSSRLFRHFMHQNWLFHTANNSPTLINKTANETYRVTLGMIQPVLIMLSKLVLTAFIALGIFLLNPWVAILGLTLFGSCYLLIYRLIKSALVRNGTIVSVFAVKRFKAMSEGFGGIKDTLILNKQEKFSAAYESYSREVATSQSKSQILGIAPRYVMEVIAFGSVISLVIFLIISQDGNLENILPTISIYALAGFKLMPALQSAFSNLSSIKGNIPAFESIKEDLDQSTLLKTTSTNNISFHQNIQFNQLSFTYPQKDTPALNNISVQISKNKSIAFVGPSGSGKSTIIDILLGLIPPNKGELLVDNTPITEANKVSWQSNIGYVPQQIFLADTSIAENIAFGESKDEINQEHLKKSIELSQLEDLINTLENGIETEVGERGVQLSGGQRQRIGIARALYKQPNVLVFDEATSALDGITEKLIIESINNLAGNRTLIMIAHRLSTVEKCDNIYFMENGEITDQGNYDDLLNRNSKFKRMATNQDH